MSSLAPVRFGFRFTSAYRRAGRLFGVRPGSAEVVVGDRTLRAHFGPWSCETQLVNIAAVQVTGPYTFLKTAGPARLGVTDRSLTFASNGDRGVQLTFRRPVPGIEPLGILRHPELTVTVEDIDGLVDVLRDRSRQDPAAGPAGA